MSGNKKLYLNGWFLVAALALAFGVGLTATGAFAGRLTDTSAGLSAKAVKATSPSNPGGTDLVMSQVYGGGGNTGAPYTNDFIEIFNPTAGSISIAGWSVQYASSTGSSWSKTDITGTIPAGGYFLVQEAAGSSCAGLPCGIPLPTADITGTINMAQASGKVALVNNGTLLAGTCPIPGATVVDFVGFGTANCFEGTGPTAALSSTTSGQRRSNGCQDNDDNTGDFQVLAPAPRNSASPANSCGGTPTPTSTTIPTCGPGSDYGIFPAPTVTFVAGVDDTGNHCSACTTAITLPFPVELYGLSLVSVNASNNGNLQFNSASGVFNNSCLPSGGFNNAIMPLWDGLNTTAGITGTFSPGIYTTVLGSTPSRIFVIEWRACRFEGAGTTCNNGADNFEVLLYEGVDQFDFIYNTVDQLAGGSATVGVQRGSGASYSQYSCNQPIITNGLALRFRPYTCGEITSTPTITLTPTASNTPSPTRTPTDTATVTITPGGLTLTPTNTVTPTATHAPSNSVVISEFRVRGPAGGNDEFIELYNKTGSPIDISGWQINGSSACSTTVTTRLTITTGTTLPAYSYFLAVNSIGYTGTVTGDATYTTGISDSGGMALLNNSSVVIDAVGMCATTEYYEGTSLPISTTSNIDQSYERKIGGAAGNAQDTNNNADDFLYHTPGNPQNLASPPVPPCPPTAENVSMGDSFFNPASLTVNQGATVSWTNNGALAHTSTSSAPLWDSGTLNPNDTFSYTFNDPGVYPYVCTFHFGMNGTITVLAGCPPAATPTATATPPPSGIVNGHLTWNGISQPNTRNIGLTATLTLCNAGVPVNFVVTCDTNGNFSVASGLADGTYNWRIKGPRSLANAGSLTIAGGTVTQEFGKQKAGDTNNSNVVNSTDFNLLKATLGKGCADPGYDGRNDFNNDCLVNTSDFNLQRNNFGLGGSAANCP